ncbi:hypothetical protein AB0M39_02370 [Streptomyces sp. NPDC051907]|uniref:hypothetical protein n=1 Tax=Streptomyces sp. NPDC051907 TaxID=3155284 RepID=UPI00342826FF
MDQPSHERLRSETFGSIDWLWSGDDEFRFAKSDRALAGLVLKVPETESVLSFDPWLNAHEQPGIIYALKPENFSAASTDIRQVSDDGTRLICAHQALATQAGEVRRLRINSSLAFVFVDQIYSGWILQDPVEYLVQEWEYSPIDVAPDSLRGLLKDYLTLIVEPKIDRMQDGDPELLTELENLIERCSAHPYDPRRDVLLDQAIDLRENWYEGVI